MPTLYEVTYLRDGEVLKALIWGESPDRAAAYVEERLGGRVMIVNGEGAENWRPEISTEPEPETELDALVRAVNSPGPDCPDCGNPLMTSQLQVKSEGELNWFAARCDHCRQELDVVWNTKHYRYERIVKHDHVRLIPCRGCRRTKARITDQFHEDAVAVWYATKCECGRDGSVLYFKPGAQDDER